MRRGSPRAVGRRLALVAVAAAAAVAGAACGPAAAPAGSPVATPPSPPGSPAQALRVVVDTDVAYDDLVAVASLLRDPRVTIEAITVSGTGEAHCEGGTRVVRWLVAQLRAEPLPVSCGPADPLGPAQPFPDAWRADADAGSGLPVEESSVPPDPRSAQQLLVDLALDATAEPLEVLTLGPLTNLAAAIALEPSIVGRIRVTSMAGAVGVAGNVLPIDGGPGEPVAEWNAHADPTALRAVVESGVDLTLIPLDATRDVPLTRELADRLAADRSAAPASIVADLWAANPARFEMGLHLWDPLTALALRQPSLVTTRVAMVVVIEGDGLDGGRTVEDPAGRLVTVAIAADRAAVEAALLASLRIGPPPGAG